MSPNNELLLSIVSLSLNLNRASMYYRLSEFKGSMVWTARSTSDQSVPTKFLEFKKSFENFPEQVQKQMHVSSDQSMKCISTLTLKLNSEQRRHHV